jgi:hypothetical protein
MPGFDGFQGTPGSVGPRWAFPPEGLAPPDKYTGAMYRYSIQIGDRPAFITDLRKPYFEGDVLELEGERFRVVAVTEVEQVGPKILICQPLEPAAS